MDITKMQFCGKDRIDETHRLCDVIATNSISSVSADTTSNFVFNLYGQKANATDGFRIQNGKIILVK